MLDQNYQYKGIVISLKANYALVRLIGDSHKCFNPNGNSKNFLCTIRKKLMYKRSFVFVGDYVILDSIDWKNFRAVVIDIETRNSLLSRPPVANVSDVVIVLSCQEPPLNFEQANRFLLTAEDCNLNITLVLSKCDLIDLGNIEFYLKRFRAWGYKTFAVSFKDGYGLDSLRSSLTSNKLSVLCGPSGVGKSSLINYLLPDKALVTSDVSPKLKRGRNTTRNVDLYSLGQESLLADTPGFNRPDLAIDPLRLPYLFPELRVQIQESACKFRNCSHRDEPGCLVDKSWDRYSLYRSILEEMLTSNLQSQGD